jgi:hypothetical protein
MANNIECILFAGIFILNRQALLDSCSGFIIENILHMPNILFSHLE